MPQEDTQDFGLLTEEEEQAFKNPESESSETETTSEQEKVETKETLPPGSEGEEKVEPKPEEKPEEKKEEEVKPGKKPDGAPSDAPIDGILTKDGKNVIPFNVLEQERAKRQQLEAELAELKKPKAEPGKVTAGPKPEEKPKPADPDAFLKDMGVDLNALAAKAYESQDGMAEVLKTALLTGVQIARQEAKRIAQTEGGQSATAIIYEAKLGQIKAANPWLTPDLEKIARVYAEDELMAKPPTSVDDFVAAAEHAIVKVKELVKAGQPAVDLEAERKKIREEVTKEVMAKFNIKAAKVTTLSGVRNVNPEVLNKFDQLDQLTGVEYEDAFSQLTPAEREAYIHKRSA